MANATVTVLVPSYNHAPFIQRALRSIRKQTLAPKKLIVIDDGSKDESSGIIEAELEKCGFSTELIVRENRGLCATLNEGFAMAAKTGSEYFAYLGSDDVWLPQFLESRARLLDSRPQAVLAFGHAYLIDEQDQIIDCTAEWTDFADGNVLPFLLRGIIFSSPSVLYRSAALAKHRWNEDSVLEDYEMYLKLSADGEFARDAGVLCGWRQHGANVSHDISRMHREWIAAQDRQAAKLPMTRAELDALQKELKFNAAFDYVRHGRKKEAFRLMRENLPAASPAQTAKLGLRLAIPRGIFAWNRERKKAAAVKRYGKLEI
jgi:alpha-1,3-rhamnosyltransferase